MSKVFWKEYGKVQKLSEEVHKAIIRQIFPEATNELVSFVVRKHSLCNPCRYWDWCKSNWFDVADEDSYDPYTILANKIINDPNPLGVATNHIDERRRKAIEDHKYLMEEKILERQKFERTLKSWVGLFVRDSSVSEHYYQVISNVLSPYSIR